MTERQSKRRRLVRPAATPAPEVSTEPEATEAPEVYEHVMHPEHYNNHPSGVECIDVIEHMPLNTGLVFKYLWREGQKPGETSGRDFNKALFYMLREMNRQGIEITVDLQEFIDRNDEVCNADEG